MKSLYSPVCKKRRRDMFVASNTTISKIVHSQPYELASAILIVLNAMFVVWETQRRARLVTMEATAVQIYHDDLYFQLAANVFCAVFLLDLVLRGATERWLFFLSKEWAWNLSKEWKWNVFDTFVVLSALLEVIVQW